MTAATQGKTPWHLWAVGIVGLLWNAYGGYDYFMTKTGGEAYLRSLGMTEAQIAHYASMPAWMTAVWAVGVWGALLGTVLLLLRSKFAVPVFAASLVAFVASVVYSAFISPVPGMGATVWAMYGVIFAGCVFFLWYSMRARRLGHIR
jgi:hypothetical protein